MTDAVFRWKSAAGPVAATPITAEQALRGDHDAGLVQIEGRLIGLDRAAHDPALVILSGNIVFPAVLPNEGPSHSVPAWKEGSKLRITGICSVQTDANIPIIAMTAPALKDDEHRCLQAGMDGYVAKPITLAALYRAIEAACGADLPDRA